VTPPAIERGLSAARHRKDYELFLGYFANVSKVSKGLFAAGFPSYPLSIILAPYAYINTKPAPQQPGQVHSPPFNSQLSVHSRFGNSGSSHPSHQAQM